MATQAGQAKWLLAGMLGLIAGCAPELQTRRAASDAQGGATPPVALEPTGAAGGPATDPMVAAVPGGRSTLGATALPCDIAAVLSTSCQGCHAANPGLQAPMALMSREDLMAPAVSDPTRAVYELMLERVHDDFAPMPPAPSHRLSDAALGAFDTMGAGGPSEAGAGGCASAAVAGSAASPFAPPQPEEIDTCHRVAAHGVPALGDTSAHQVESGEHYSCFYFDIPWQAGAQALTVRTQPGMAAHHIELFQMENAAAPGSFSAQQSNCGFAPRLPLAIWGLGQPAEQPMPEDVGLALLDPAAGRGLMMEIHYFNPGAPMQDQSQIEICTARTPRAHLAAISVMGAALFSLPPGQETVVHGTCTPAAATDIHVFRSYPHMHSRGRHFASQVARAGGQTESFLDFEFDANNQRSYDLDVVLRPGDRMQMDCHFFNDTGRTLVQGYRTDEEMCNQFVYAWPAGALGPVGTGNDVPCVI